MPLDRDCVAEGAVLEGRDGSRAEGAMSKSHRAAVVSGPGPEG